MKSLGLIPIRNFGIVVPGIYRSAQPIYLYEYQWLKRLGITKIINLRSESRHDNLARKLGIEVVNINIPDHFAPTMLQVNQFKRHIGNNVLFHCAHGHGRTSTFSVITNVINGKSIDEAIDIEKNKFKYTFKHRKQEEFLRNFKNE